MVAAGKILWLKAPWLGCDNINLKRWKSLGGGAKYDKVCGHIAEKEQIPGRATSSWALQIASHKQMRAIEGSFMTGGVRIGSDERDVFNEGNDRWGKWQSSGWISKSLVTLF